MFIKVQNREAMKRAISVLTDFLFERDVPEDCVFYSKLVVSELIDNIFRHSDGDASLTGEVKGEFIELTVNSSAYFCPPTESRCSDVYAESGRGLFLVDSVCAERTATEEGGIKVRIRISSSAAQEKYGKNDGD